MALVIDNSVLVSRFVLEQADAYTRCIAQRAPWEFHRAGAVGSGIRDAGQS